LTYTTRTTRLLKNGSTMAALMWLMLMLVALSAAPATAQVSIYDVLSGDDRFSTLKVLIDALGANPDTQSTSDLLKDTTSAITVFAPTDTALVNWVSANFGTLAEATADVNAITLLLSYHLVVTGKVVASDLSVGQEVSPGSTISKIVPPTITTASAQTVLIEEADLMAGNSVIHVVDHVLDPLGGAWMFGGETRLSTTLAIATGSSTHATLVSVLTALGEPYVGLVSGTAKKLLVVAPDDDAFTKFVTDANTTLDALLAEVNMTTLKNVIDYHVFYDADATVQGANGMSPNPRLKTSMEVWMKGKKLKMLNEGHLTVKTNETENETTWTLTTELNQTVTSNLMPTSSGFLMPVTEVLSPTPAPAPAPPNSGSSFYHVSMLTVACALTTVFGMMVAV